MSPVADWDSLRLYTLLDQMGQKGTGVRITASDGVWYVDAQRGRGKVYAGVGTTLEQAIVALWEDIYSDGERNL